jgi:ABC-type anion transport system duplicated permease subunit
MLAVLRGERRDQTPVWMMRQAGRYLPEYRELRAEKGGFLDLVYDSDAAANITLQPLQRFAALDAAILFSDILIVPFAIGQNLTFVAGEGPRLTPTMLASKLQDLTPHAGRLDPIYEKAAQTLGSSEWKTFRTVVFPLAWPGIISGIALSFARAIGEFGATLMVAGNIPGKTQTIPTAIYFAVESGKTGLANRLVLIMTIFSFVLILVLNAWLKKRNYIGRQG